MQQRHLKIQGKVQGVGYRRWFATQAQALSVKGYVQNMPDSSVEAVITADPDTLEQLIQHSWQGPSRAEVSNIQQTVLAEHEVVVFEDFQIRR